MAAVHRGHVSVLQYLLSQGVDMPKDIGKNVRALRKGTTVEIQAVFQVLLDHGWDINYDDRECQTALKYVTLSPSSFLGLEKS